MKSSEKFRDRFVKSLSAQGLFQFDLDQTTTTPSGLRVFMGDELPCFVPDGYVVTKRLRAYLIRGKILSMVNKLSIVMLFLATLIFYAFTVGFVNYFALIPLAFITGMIYVLNTTAESFNLQELIKVSASIMVFTEDGDEIELKDADIVLVAIEGYGYEDLIETEGENEDDQPTDELDSESEQSD